MLINRDTTVAKEATKKCGAEHTPIYLPPWGCYFYICAPKVHKVDAKIYEMIHQFSFFTVIRYV